MFESNIALRRAVTGLVGVSLAAGLGVLGGLATEVTAAPLAAYASSNQGGEITRSEVLARAQDWADHDYTYTQTGYASDVEGDHSYRRDCSGLVSMAWHLTTSYNTGDYMNGAASYTLGSLNDLKPGDAMVRDGHMELFARWKSDSDHSQGAYVYSFNTSGETVRSPNGESNFGNRGFNSWSEMSTYRPIRYDKIVDDPTPTPPEDIPISGDWDGDGDKTIGVYRPTTSTFYLRNVNSGAATIIFKFGHGPSGDIPVVGDWNNDGKDTVGVFRPSESMWYLTNGTTSTDLSFKFGHGPSGDLPVAGDWNNDGKDTVGVFRPSESMWYLTNGTTSMDLSFKFGHGPSGDLPVAGDWNNDGKDTVGVFRPSSSTWYLTNGTTSTDLSFIYGHGPSGDVPVPGDWDGDGDDTPGVRRPSDNTVYLRNTNSGGAVDSQFVYGI
ncbi:hypothetical protein [Micromonospora sp. NPDC005367]|uniref:hypothetical protein n=1 Tax=Micromonospora sp. NPDC005367 TaxID=3155590 RepID=UPI0033BD629B